MEEKKFMNDRLGPSIGCAGNVVQSVNPKSRLVREGIGKVEKLLRKTDYRGPIDLNTIANKEGLWGLEFTVRFGYDALQAMTEIRRGTVVGLLHGIATGSPTVGTLTADFSIGVRVTIPPYPNEEAKAVAGIPIIGVNDKNSKYIWLSDVVAGGDRYESAGCDGNLLTVTARGQTVRECRRRVYRTINNLTIPHLQYRTDIGERVDDDLSKLKEWNYL
jgi:phosphoribosylamine-glycine ligase